MMSRFCSRRLIRAWSWNVSAFPLAASRRSLAILWDRLERHQRHPSSLGLLAPAFNCFLCSSSFLGGAQACSRYCPLHKARYDYAARSFFDLAKPRDWCGGTNTLIAPVPVPPGRWCLAGCSRVHLYFALTLFLLPLPCLASSWLPLNASVFLWLFLSLLLLFFEE